MLCVKCSRGLDIVVELLGRKRLSRVRRGASLLSYMSVGISLEPTNVRTYKPILC